MKSLYTEIMQRFPEIQNKLSEGDEELPYILMIYLADWLKEDGVSNSPTVIERVVSFARWCETQPPGKDAGDDVITIFMVGFCEHLFDSPRTRALLPHLISREDMIRNADYLRHWVGNEDYTEALQYYDRKA